jgi:hypothetical protein
MKTKAERIQDDIYADALVVQAALVDSLTAIAAAKSALADTSLGAPIVDIGLLDTATDEHRRAHVRWENLVVSENSMGFHNPSEVSGQLNDALAFAQSAKQNAEDAILGAGCIPTLEICDDGNDNDCDGLADGDDPDCTGVDCSSNEDKTSCNDDPACRWNKNKGCSNR